MRIFKVFLLILLGLMLFCPLVIFNASAANGNRTTQYYSVVFDQEQEAAVMAKLTYFNSGKEEIKNLSLEIPGTTVRIINAVQEQYETSKYCKLYDNSNTTKPNQEEKCLESAEQENSQPSYALLTYDESKIQKTSNSNIIDFSLKAGIPSQKSGTIILYYKTQGFVNKVWNGYKYDFQTIKSPYDIDNVRVSINVADDLYIKSSVKGSTNYLTDLPRAITSLSNESFAVNSSLSVVSQEIQTNQGVVKETSSLDPGENFQVEGKYYNNSFVGELPTIVGVGITFLIILGVLVIVIKNENKH